MRRMQESADTAGICGARQGRQFASVTPEWRSRPALAARVEAIQLCRNEHGLWTNRQATTGVNVRPAMRHCAGACIGSIGQACGSNQQRLGAGLSCHGPIPRRFRYNFNFNGGFNPTKAIIAASLKFHDYRRSADVRLTSVSMERRE
jgi:hypothetical protein